jgi:hypothetical protein
MVQLYIRLLTGRFQVQILIAEPFELWRMVHTNRMLWPVRLYIDIRFAMANVRASPG